MYWLYKVLYIVLCPLIAKNHKWDYILFFPLLKNIKLLLRVKAEAKLKSLTYLCRCFDYSNWCTVSNRELIIIRGLSSIAHFFSASHRWCAVNFQQLGLHQWSWYETLECKIIIMKDGNHGKQQRDCAET